MEMLWIPLISQIGRNHQNMWKKSVFLKVLDNVWTCFEITSWQKSSKKIQKRRKPWKKRVFFPLLFRPGDIFIFISIYLPAITCSHFKFRPSPIYWPTVCLPIYLYVCIYIYIYLSIFICIYLPAITCSHFKFRPSPTYWPTVCALFIYMYVYIYIYVCMYVCIYFFHSYKFTCNHLQSF